MTTKIQKITILVALFIAISSAALAQTVATFNLETGTGAGWTWVDPVLTITDGTNITITGQVDIG